MLIFEENECGTTRCAITGIQMYKWAFGDSLCERIFLKIIVAKIAHTLISDMEIIFVVKLQIIVIHPFRIFQAYGEVHQFPPWIHFRFEQRLKQNFSMNPKKYGLQSFLFLHECILLP